MEYVQDEDRGSDHLDMKESVLQVLSFIYGSIEEKKMNFIQTGSNKPKAWFRVDKQDFPLTNSIIKFILLYQIEPKMKLNTSDCKMGAASFQVTCEWPANDCKTGS